MGASCPHCNADGDISIDSHTEHTLEWTVMKQSHFCYCTQATGAGTAIGGTHLLGSRTTIWHKPTDRGRGLEPPLRLVQQRCAITRLDVRTRGACAAAGERGETPYWRHSIPVLYAVPSSQCRSSSGYACAVSGPVHSARAIEKTHLGIVLFGVLLEDACRLLDIADRVCPVGRGVLGEQDGADGAQPPRELLDRKDVAVQAGVQDRLQMER